MENPKFLKEKYGLHNEPEVIRAGKRGGEKTPLNAEQLIQKYLDRFKEILERKDPKKREQGIGLLKNILLDKFATKYEDIPQSYWKAQENIMTDRGQLGDWRKASDDVKEKIKKQQAEALLSDQKASLEQWIDYFALEDSQYIPDFMKYWIFRSVLGMQEYDKDKKTFGKRSKGEVKQFPDLNQEALAYVVDSTLKNFQGTSPEFEYDIQRDQREKFLQYLKQENFAKMYSWAVEQINPIPEHLLLETEGEWKYYEQDGDYKALAKSIQGKGTGWCTAGENTAKTQLSTGDFYVYYTKDEEGNFTIPRIAIRREADKIAEVRGIAYKQNLDPYVNEVLEKKLDEFPDKDEYLKKDKDMKTLTEIDRKTKAQEPLNSEDLVFLYEIDSKIQHFGYEKDPRIKELRSQRNTEEDMPIVFECDISQIARKPEEVNEKTKAYVGPLFDGIFLKNIEHIYTSFPEGKIQKYQIQNGGKNKEKLEKEMQDKKITISDWAKQLLESKDFTTAKKPKKANLVRVSVKDFGFSGKATTDQIYMKAKELGLELCPAETGPNFRLKYNDQPMNECIYIGMKQISDRSSPPCVFLVLHLDDGLWLHGRDAEPSYAWDGSSMFVFLLPQV